jgi:DNA-binding beta-propeller fold protein YncE
VRRGALPRRLVARLTGKRVLRMTGLPWQMAGSRTTRFELAMVADSDHSEEIGAGTGAVITLCSDFDLPAGVAVDTGGNLYVADSYDSVIREIVKANGTLITL